jgi:pyridoxal phosphate enzyme (YggS family)
MLFGNIREIYKRIARSAMRAGRSPEEVRLIAVTKTVGADAVAESVDIGLREFGESRVQEARDKILTLRRLYPSSRIIWHLIGHLQKNKAKTAVELFDIIHSVDSLELAEALNRHAGVIGKSQKILIQVKLSQEESKQGILKEDLLDLIRAIQGMRNVKVEGLMTIPPFFEDTELVRPYFRDLRSLRGDIEQAGFELPELSMGMSDDFDIAIEEGATMVRVGAAIFGKRKTEAA